MEKFSLCCDLSHNPRESEGSRIVASKWGNTTDAYLSEIPDASNTQYFNLTAERLLYRNKLLSLPIDQALVECEAMQSARPFGPCGPDFAMFLDASVRLAMSFVPLTPIGGSGKAVMARLYCIGALSAKHAPPFDEGVDLPGIDNYSWFVAGVPEVFNGERLSGRSWLLAAHLLMRIVEKNDRASAYKLATGFITTGDVENGRIKEIEIGKKAALADQGEFKSYKWIIPMKNANEMTNVPSRKIEKPATLDEAYKLIETMQNTMTRDLCVIVNRQIDTKADEWDQRVDRIKDLLFKGADPNAVVQGKCAWQMYREKHDALCNSEQSDAWSLEQASLIDRVFSFYGAVPQFFFMLAHAGEAGILESIARVFDIDAIDCAGETALDFAEEAKDTSAKELLVACGAKKRGRFLVNSNRFWIALASLVTDGYLGRQEGERVLLESLDNGLSANDKFTWGSDGVVKRGTITEEMPVPVDKEPMEEWEYYEWKNENYKQHEFASTRYESTVLLEALYAGSTPIVEKCLVAGISPKVEIRTKYGSVLREMTIEGKVIESHDDELVVPDAWRKSKPIGAFIRSANARNEFPDKDLAAKVIKYLSELEIAEL